MRLPSLFQLNRCSEEHGGLQTSLSNSIFPLEKEGAGRQQKQQQGSEEGAAELLQLLSSPRWWCPFLSSAHPLAPLSTFFTCSSATPSSLCGASSGVAPHHRPPHVPSTSPSRGDHHHHDGNTSRQQAERPLTSSIEKHELTVGDRRPVDKKP